MTQYCAVIKENKGDLDVLMGGSFLRHIKRKKHSIEENDPFCINYNVDAYVFKCIFFSSGRNHRKLCFFTFGEGKRDMKGMRFSLLVLYLGSQLEDL